MQELEAMGLQMRLNVERIEFPTEQLISLDENDIDTNIIIEKPKKIDEEKPKKIDEEKPKKIDEDKPKKIDEDKPKKIDEDKTKECPPGKVYNPETKRCISESNPLVKKLGLKKTDEEKPKKTNEEKPKKTNEEKPKKTDEEKPKKTDEEKPKKTNEEKPKECPPGKVYNPVTKRCISESNPLVKKLGLMKGGDDGDDGNISDDDDEISENDSDTKIIEI
jgi:hypothetical protein